MLINLPSVINSSSQVISEKSRISRGKSCNKKMFLPLNPYSKELSISFQKSFKLNSPARRYYSEKSVKNIDDYSFDVNFPNKLILKKPKYLISVEKKWKRIGFCGRSWNELKNAQGFKEKLVKNSRDFYQEYKERDDGLNIVEKLLRRKGVWKNDDEAFNSDKVIENTSLKRIRRRYKWN